MSSGGRKRNETLTLVGCVWCCVVECRSSRGTLRLSFVGRGCGSSAWLLQQTIWNNPDVGIQKVHHAILVATFRSLAHRPTQ